MPGITLAQAEQQLSNWIDADIAVAKSQSYTVGTRQLTRADAKEITDKINYWEGKVKLLSGNSGRRVSQVNLP